MNTLTTKQIQTAFSEGFSHVPLDTGLEIKFPVDKNPRRSIGRPAQLNHIEISPFGLHWPDLDEDLSFEGLAKGDFG